MMTCQQMTNLELAGLRPLDPNISVRVSQYIQCLVCGLVFKSFPKAKITSYKKHGMQGCSTCTAKQRQINTHVDNISKLADTFTFADLPELNSFTNKTEVTVTNKNCGHTFTTKFGYLVSGVRCSNKECSDKISRKNIQIYNERVADMDVHPNKLTTVEFKELFESEKKRLGFIVSLHNFMEYEGYASAIECKCDRCGDVTILKIMSLLWRPDDQPAHGCDKCFRLDMADRYRLPIRELRDQIFVAHGTKYTYPYLETEYINKHSYLTIVCPKHGEFFQKGYPHTQAKQGCPSCAKQSYSQKSIRWLTHLEKELKIDIQHAENGGEFRIPGTRYLADGYCKDNNTIYEFHGSAFHGDPACYDPDSFPSPYDKTQTARQLYDKTINREQEILNLGFNLVVIWESEFDKMRLI